MIYHALIMSDCYIIATLGTSPAVISELAYALVTAEHYSIVGIEVWTTVAGRNRLIHWIEQGAWARLCEAVRERGFDAPLPNPSHQTVELSSVAAAVGRGERPFLIRVFEAGNEPLGDVRSSEDARVMDAKLFERVRALTQSIGSVQLIGSLAGGRKTMSAGLQGAFSMLGRPNDRLVHLLLDPRVEEVVQTRTDFVAPTNEFAQLAKVKVNEQITLHDVHFPRLLDLLARGRWQRQTIADLISQDYPRFLESVSRHQGGLRATLRRRETTTEYVYTITSDRERVEPRCVNLPQAQGRTLAALVLCGGQATLSQLVEKLREVNPSDAVDNNAVSQRLLGLRESLSQLDTSDLLEFGLENPKRSIYTIEAALDDRIAVNQHDLWD